MLSELAYNKSIYDDWWVALIYVSTIYYTSYYIAKSLLRSDK